MKAGKAAGKGAAAAAAKQELRSAEQVFLSFESVSSILRTPYHTSVHIICLWEPVRKGAYIQML